LGKYKIVFFDIDDTLCGINCPIDKETIELLQKLIDNGIQIVLASGKPVDHIGGMIRQTGLKNVFIVGENGYVNYLGGGFPPDEIFTLPINEKDATLMQELKNDLRKQSFFKNKDCWLQPLQGYINCTYKNNNKVLRDEIIAYFRGILQRKEFENFEMFVHSDAIEIVFKGFNKGTAIKLLIEKLGLTKDETISVGNGENDIPMFCETGLAIGVNLPEKFHDKVNKNFSNISDALNFIIASNTKISKYNGNQEATWERVEK